MCVLRRSEGASSSIQSSQLSKCALASNTFTHTRFRSHAHPQQISRFLEIMWAVITRACTIPTLKVAAIFTGHLHPSQLCPTPSHPIPHVMHLTGEFAPTKHMHDIRTIPYILYNILSDITIQFRCIIWYNYSNIHPVCLDWMCTPTMHSQAMKTIMFTFTPTICVWWDSPLRTHSHEPPIQVSWDWGGWGWRWGWERGEVEGWGLWWVCVWGER